MLQVSTQVSNPQIFTWRGANTSLGVHPIPAEVEEKLAAYEQQTNDLQEQVADLSAKFVRLESENQSMRVWYTGRIISLWEGYQQLGERMTRLMNGMVQVVGEDNAKHKRLAELMEEAHLSLGVPFTRYDAPFPPPPIPLPPAHIPPAFLEGMDILPSPAPVNLDPKQGQDVIATSMVPAEPLPSQLTPIPDTSPKGTNGKETEDGEITGDESGPLPPLPRRSGSMSVTNTPRVTRVGTQRKCGLSAVPEVVEEGNRLKKQKIL